MVWNTRQRPNIPAAILSLIWFAIITIPLFYIVESSLKNRSEYLNEPFMSWPASPSLDNYRNAWESGFGRYFVNTIVITVATVAIVLVLSIPASYSIARSNSKLVSKGFSMVLLGLAIPAQAVIVPLYLIITKMHVYDTLIAIILPTAAFSLPVAVLVMSSSLRDIPKELYEAMTLDGANSWMLLRRLALPLSKPTIMTISVYTSIGAWNGFLFPLVLTQSESQRVLTLGLWNFRGQFGTDFPALLAAVVLSAIPMLIAYLIGRRQLVSGLTAGAGK
jgi:ABC-type glycerol-3-phosphate transport system permease component